MAFQFGFSGDVDMEQADGPSSSFAHRQYDSIDFDLMPVIGHSLQELLDRLPERISYSTVKIESPSGRVAYLPKRDLYDVRVQLLSEGPENDGIVDQLEKSDLRSGVYEGGFKTWECSQDLASLLLDRGPRNDISELIRCDQIVELGAGTALPTLVLFRHALLNAIPITFVVQDYNDFVIRLVTLPNILLTWAANTQYHEFSTPDLDSLPHGDLEINHSLVERFIAEMKCKSINFVFISGPWSDPLANLIPRSAPALSTLVLAAETIYSPASTTSFVDLVFTLLRRVRSSKAIIGAKKIYFGVGGSVDGMIEACNERRMLTSAIEISRLSKLDRGIGTALIEVRLP